MYMHIIIFLAHAQVMNDRIAKETKRKGNRLTVSAYGLTSHTPGPQHETTVAHAIMLTNPIRNTCRTTNWYKNGDYMPITMG